ncbi:iron-containing alcohol dehydrogenase [Paenibacillus puerhi]|uniref:iron-containing alcohol dehydrogenase n=1 Tax=Paenibacillus puerhi TaxID=2692622 RepID=UPI00135685B0|nr:iron-containing alcohol dehydrogenase [Paenibacillus puerhi]
MAAYQFRTAGRVIAGVHVAEQAVDHIRELGTFRSVLVVSQPSIQRSGYLDTLAAMLVQSGLSCRIYADVQPEPTEEQLTGMHQQVVQGGSFDLIIGVGGGSVLDAVKLLAVMETNTMSIREMLGTGLIARAGLPTVMIPTTSGTGSEVTPNAIVTLPEEELKVAAVSPYLYPQLVLLDPVLTLTLPPAITAATGMDAFTHALESYISQKANPISDMFALESIRLIASSLSEAYHDGGSLQARERMLVGSMYGGMALSSSGTAAVHALAYPLGGKFKIAHGVANAMLLTHVMAYNLDAITGRLAEVAAAMKLPSAEEGSDSQAAEGVIARIAEWTRELRIPQNLRDYGVGEADLEPLTAAASQVKRLLDNNPKPLDLDDIRRIYRQLMG